MKFTLKDYLVLFAVLLIVLTFASSASVGFHAIARYVWERGFE